MDVRFSGMKLDDEQKRIVNMYRDSFCRACEVSSLHINLKGHKKAGERMSYTIQLHAELARKGKKTLEAVSDVTDWDFQASVKGAFAKLEKEIKSMEKKSWFSAIFKRRRQM